MEASPGEEEKAENTKTKSVYSAEIKFITSVYFFKDDRNVVHWAIIN